MIPLSATYNKHDNYDNDDNDNNDNGSRSARRSGPQHSSLPWALAADPTILGVRQKQWNNDYDYDFMIREDLIDIGFFATGCLQIQWPHKWTHTTTDTTTK